MQGLQVINAAAVPAAVLRVGLSPRPSAGLLSVLRCIIISVSLYIVREFVTCGFKMRKNSRILTIF